MNWRALTATLVTLAALGWSVSYATAQAPAPSSEAAKPEAAKTDAAKPEAAKPAAPKPVVQKRFASAEEAVDALVAALRQHKTETVISILGGESRPLIVSGDAVADRRARETFVKAYDEAHALVTKDAGTTLTLGTDEWPFPIPLVKDGDRWRFDGKEGREEILARRIGRNELYTIQTCLAYVDAQREYYSEDRIGKGVLQYAQKFVSAPGKRDGLYWVSKPGEPPSPLGELVARARGEGYRRASSGPTPFHGYLFKILTSQGPGAPDGAYNYVVKGQMIAGFALVAYPAQYGASGVMSFLVNHDGVVYEKDLGPTTAAVATSLRSFDPSGWAKVDAQN
ncbi:MAG TPA: DUF2950 domain-containing protein [Methylomirabilota bacterium]|nr:DUF2950 domain-containing protein [Methylomirabilota bacterium]